MHDTAIGVVGVEQVVCAPLRRVAVRSGPAAAPLPTAAAMPLVPVVPTALLPTINTTMWVPSSRAMPALAMPSAPVTNTAFPPTTSVIQAPTPTATSVAIGSMAALKIPANTAASGARTALVRSPHAMWVPSSMAASTMPVTARHRHMTMATCQHLVATAQTVASAQDIHRTVRGVDRTAQPMHMTAQCTHRAAKPMHMIAQATHMTAQVGTSLTRASVAGLVRGLAAGLGRLAKSLATALTRPTALCLAPGMGVETLRGKVTGMSCLAKGLMAVMGTGAVPCVAQGTGTDRPMGPATLLSQATAPCRRTGTGRVMGVLTDTRMVIRQAVTATQLAGSCKAQVPASITASSGRGPHLAHPRGVPFPLAHISVTEPMLPGWVGHMGGTRPVVPVAWGPVRSVTCRVERVTTVGTMGVRAGGRALACTSPTRTTAQMGAVQGLAARVVVAAAAVRRGAGLRQLRRLPPL